MTELPSSREGHTSRGFEIVTFVDANCKACSLQQSSAIGDTDRGWDNPGSSFVWLGREDERMHLAPEHVRQLIRYLRHWLANGTFGFKEVPHD